MIGIGIISRFQKNMNSLNKKNIAGAIREVYDNRERVRKALESYKREKLGDTQVNVKTVLTATEKIIKLNELQENTESNVD